MKKIIGAVIVGLCGISFDAMCGYEPLKEENNNQHPKSGSASSVSMNIQWFNASVLLIHRRLLQE